MKTFTEHINEETETIKQFLKTQNNIEIKEIKNEGYSRYDFDFISGTTGNPFKIYGVCEAKTRNSNSNDYGDTGVLIELDKLNSICKEVTSKKEENINGDYRPYYLSKYNDVTYLFNLEKCQLGNIIFKRCPKTSSIDGNTEWIDKACFLLNPKDAIIKIYND
ncbi:hypothetical protein [Cochleicola gelatinilyticus]|uniref:Uncharacterized protein n=1 Tax=Cochleicola gelatinilyticus TaxID=1763537 RepID=A0A167HMK0_9FLAO|nr:hypothetical protein [Cochleicola gelatinilyticus]OAB78773.1 hypothetical protein ULVI_09330 [Cochleicola gelatinilyticus]